MTKIIPAYRMGPPATGEGDLSFYRGLWDGRVLDPMHRDTLITLAKVKGCTVKWCRGRERAYAIATAQLVEQKKVADLSCKPGGGTARRAK